VKAGATRWVGLICFERARLQAVPQLPQIDGGFQPLGECGFHNDHFARPRVFSAFLFRSQEYLGMLVGDSKQL